MGGMANDYFYSCSGARYHRLACRISEASSLRTARQKPAVKPSEAVDARGAFAQHGSRIGKGEHVIQGLRVTVVPAQDVDRARAFFERVLGKSVAFQDGSRWAEFKFASGARLAVASPEEASSSGPGAVAVFESDDLEADIARLREAGITAAASRDMGSHGRVVTFESDWGTFQIFGRASQAGRPGGNAG
jgi:predicted enzyme related to lactoylglutathione lyase